MLLIKLLFRINQASELKQVIQNISTLMALKFNVEPICDR